MAKQKKPSKKAEKVIVSEQQQIEEVQGLFEFSSSVGQVEFDSVRIVTFINNAVIRESQFELLKSYRDVDGNLVCVLDPNSKAEQRSYERK